MKQYLLTIDAGTTNTRVTLLNGCGEVCATQKSETGVRNTAVDGNNQRLAAAVRECLEQTLAQAGISYNEVCAVLAGGMLTSNVGLFELPHIVAPAGLDELSAAVQEVSFPELCPIPIGFIPGVRNSLSTVTLDNLSEMDIMRGEEVETLAVLERHFTGEPMVIILPGSHDKFVSVNGHGKITGCLTAISGELLAAVTNNTIIADAVGREYVRPESYNRELVLAGYKNAKNSGLGRACFSTRILNQFVTGSTQSAANYLLGAVLQSDIAALLGSNLVAVGQNASAVVAGKQPVQQALLDILEYEGCFGRVEELTLPTGQSLSALGALAIARRLALI